MKSKLIIVSIFFITCVGLFLPALSVKAQVPIVERPFGGVVSFSLPCTCSGNLWVWFTPLSLGGPVVVTGPLVYSPFYTTLYANFRIGVPTTWHLGSYLPGVQACWMYAVVGCFPFPATGLMTKVGTN